MAIIEALELHRLVEEPSEPGLYNVMYFNNKDVSNPGVVVHLVVKLSWETANRLFSELSDMLIKHGWIQIPTDSGKIEYSRANGIELTDYEDTIAFKEFSV